MISSTSVITARANKLIYQVIIKALPRLRLLGSVFLTKCTVFAHRFCRSLRNTLAKSAVIFASKYHKSKKALDKNGSVQI